MTAMPTHAPRLNAHPWSSLQSAWSYRHLLWQLIKREVAGRYRGSALGMVWPFANSLLMLGVYTFVFSTLFQSRWGPMPQTGRGEFALVLFIGLILFNLFAECLQRAPTLIIAHANYVKKVVFPLEILPWVAVGTALFNALVNLLVLLAVLLLWKQSLPATALYLPVIMVPLIVLSVGVTYFLSALGVYLRDAGQIIGTATTVLLFLSPVFYPISAFPADYQFLLKINPLSWIIEAGRGVVLFHQPLHWRGWIVSLAISSAVAAAGYWWFQKIRQGFADVL